MKRLLLVVLMMTCSVSWAEWELVDLNDEFYVFVDKSTIRKNGHIVRMWSMKNYLLEQTNSSGSKYRSSKTLYVYNCKAEETALASIIQHAGEMGDGSAVWAGNRSEREWEWAPVSPNSINQRLWEIACGKSMYKR